MIPANIDYDFNAFLDKEIDSSIQILQESQTEYSLLINDELHKLIHWAREHSPRNRSALASKLRSFADYTLIK
ncbi:Uncharacterised protein [Mannheimia haemolytica]|uniref:Uncharacterized protein n=1 Tax=Mannheimia haemolytica TaxID=75985 RepID=A0A378N0Y5_MANHA|nr:Uncharacterised protein [Mannheimia haemolytica]